MLAQDASLSPLVTRQPLSDAGVARLLGLEASPLHVSEAYLRRWLGSDSPFMAYGQAALLFAGDDAGLLVTVNPRPTAGPVAGFAYLRLRSDMTDAARQRAVGALLDEARQFAREHGAQQLRGPMAFSTWHPYRMLADDRPSAPNGFPGESVEPPTHHALYQAAGLSVTDRYETRAVLPDPATWTRHLEAEAAIARRRRDGITVRPLRREDGLSQLASLHAMVLESFAHNAHFAPIDATEFAELLLGPLPPGVEPLHLGAFTPDGRLVGICAGFGVGDTGVLKTLAVHPSVRGGRTAMAMTFAFHRQLHERGYAQALHALMRSDNRSVTMSAKYATPLRHYVLYGASLD